MDIKDLVDMVRTMSDCLVLPSRSTPVVRTGDMLPMDVLNFYKLCGGIHLFQSAPFPTWIVPPEKFVPANPVIFANVDPKQLNAIKGDISSSWYLIGIGPNSQYITIDLSPERLGNCYDSFWDRHPRDSRIIAVSFIDLLFGLLETKGEHYYWDLPGFETLGNPYQ